MPESHLAACQDCGKNYRVPSSERSYDCKACGGTVMVQAEEAPSQRSRASRDEEEGEPPRPRRTPRKQSSSLPIYIGVAVGAVVIGAGAWFAMGSGDVSAAGERDLTKVAALFDKAWGAGNQDKIIALTHPQKALAMGTLIEAAKEHRGWTSGFTPVTATDVPTAGLAPGDMATTNTDGASVDTGFALHETADGQIISRWQFSEAKESWYLYELEIPPPALGPRLQAFEAAWNAGDAVKVREFLRQEKKDELVAAFAKIADRDGWEEQYPALALTGTTPPDLAVLSKPGFSLAYPSAAKATYDTKYGKMSTSWRLDRTSDDWFLRSFKPPK